MHVVLRLACCCAILSCIVTQAAHAQTELDDRLRKALEQLRLGNHSAACRLADSVARASTDPRYRAQAWQLLAHVYQRSGMLAEALRCSEQFLKLVDRSDARNESRLDAERQDMAVLTAEVNAQLGRYAVATRWFEYAVRIPGGARLSKPTWEAATRLSWANAAKASKSSERAQAHYREAAAGTEQVLARIEKHEIPLSHRADATRVFATASLALGRADDAQQALQSLLASNPEAEVRREGLLLLADVHRQSGRPRQEIELLRPMLAGDRAEKSRLTADQAEVFERMAKALERQADSEPDEQVAMSLRKQARDALHEAADRLQAFCHAQDAADTSIAAAENLQRWHDVSVALGSWEQAREAAEKLLELRTRTLLGDDPAVFRARRSLGVCYARCERFGESAEQLDLAIEFWKRYQPVQLGELCDTRQNRAETARKQGEYDVAAQQLREVLYLLDATDPSDLRVIETQVSLGNVLSAKADYAGANKAYEAVCAAYKNVSDASARQKELYALGLLGRATISKTQTRLNDAIADCRAALVIYEEAKPARASAVQAQVLITLASLHLARYAWEAAPESDDLPQSRRNADAARALVDDGLSLETDLQCQLLHVLGLTSFREAQAHFGPSGDDDRRAARASCLEAIERWRAARKLAGGKLPAVEARTATYLAEAQLLASKLPPDQSEDYATGMLADALQDASMAVELLKRLQAYPAIHYRALLTSAKILRRQRDELTKAGTPSDVASSRYTKKIEDALRAAVEIVDEPRSKSLGTERDRAEYFSQFVEAYELLVTCLVEQHRYDEAVAWSQISRNRTFLEQVEITQHDLRAELAQAGKEKLLDALEQAVENCDRLRQQLQEQAGKPSTNEADRQRHEATASKLRDAQRGCDRLASDVRSASTAFGNLLKGGLSEEDWREARKKVVGADGLLLVYHLGPTSGELFVVMPEKVDCHKLAVTEDAGKVLNVPAGPLSSAVALGLVNRYLQCPPMRETRGAPRTLRIGEPLSSEQAMRLAEIVLPEDVRALMRKRRPSVVAVAPDGALHRLPLEALPLGNQPDKYVLDDAAIPPFAYAPSAMVMAALVPSAPPEIVWPPHVLTVGDPKYTDPKLQRLPRSADECLGWEKLFSDGGGGHVQTLLQSSATERNVRAQIGGRRYVHFAVHGVVEPGADSVFAASLALTPGAEAPQADGKLPPDDDGYLYLSEVYKLPLADCEVAVISACESNVGHTRKLEAGSTLTRAFLSAGARRVISSMWRVNDDATAALIEDFAGSVAAALKKGERPNYAEALQHARRRVREDQQRTEWRNPHYWAPFVLIGPPT